MPDRERGGAWERVFGPVEVREGRVPLLIVAPHGGRRHRPVRRGDNVNDLHTADVARELAEALDAFALVNDRLDRNEADLNRISDLSTKATGVLAVLRRLIERASEGAVVPLVVLVHGWNMAVPWCDVGVGLRGRGGDLYGTHPTLSRRAYETVLEPLLGALERRALIATVGHRYPAAGRDNATQLFSGRHHEHAHPDVAYLSRLARSGRVDAVQLELGIPLRWPGRYRDEFLAAAVEVLACSRSGSVLGRDDECERVGGRLDRAGGTTRPIASAARAREEWSLQARPPAAERTATVEAGYAVQAAIDDRGSGLFMGAEPAGAAAMVARLCLVRGDGSMLLFVGEGSWDGTPGRYRVAGLEWLATAGSPARDKRPRSASASDGDDVSVRVCFDGPMIGYDRHDAYVDLERGLASSALAEVHAQLDYRGSMQGFGRLTGFVDVEGRRIEVDVAAVAARGSRWQPARRSRTRLFVTSGSRSPLRVEAADEDDADACPIRIDGRELRVCIPGCPISGGAVLSEVPVYRQLGDGSVIEISFGVARFVLDENADEDDGVGIGLFERVALTRAR